MASDQTLITDLLANMGLINEDQVKEALDFAMKSGKSVMESLVELRYVNAFDLAKVLAQQFGMEAVVLAGKEIPRNIINLVPFDVARKYTVIPLKSDEDTLTVAMANPLQLEVLDDLSFMLKMNIEGVVATKDDIKASIERYYGTTEQTVDHMLQEMTEGDVQFAGADTVTVETEDDVPEEAPVIKLVGLLIMEAYRNRASDIHLEPMERRFRVRYRIDGVLQEVQGPPKRLQGSVISRIKIMSNLDMAEKRLPQDGRIKLKVGNGKDIDLRVSTLPATHGESVVMRILDKSSLVLGLPELGFLTDDEEIWNGLIRLPNGILLITGPTGSGKTTTLYACLNNLNRPDRKIITVEDPVEYQLGGINQVQVNESIGLSFAHVLRSSLRQAPNIMMVGEIRDLETAEIAINAALTGHLVFSTLHTNDAPGAVTRLIDQGVKPFLVASALRAVLAQRLVRSICKECKVQFKPTPQEVQLLGLDPAKNKDLELYRGKGCELCKNTGYKGRKGIFELLIVDEQIQRLIYQKVSSAVIREEARKIGMRTLRQDGVRKVLTGMTTLEEVFRITQKDTD